MDKSAKSECRYADHNYKRHWACLACRKSFKYEHSARKRKCPECGGHLVAIGLDFKAPRQNNINQWRKVELLHSAGVHFGSSGWSGPGRRPKTLRDLREQITTDKQ